VKYIEITAVYWTIIACSCYLYRVWSMPGISNVLYEKYRL